MVSNILRHPVCIKFKLYHCFSKRKLVIQTFPKNHQITNQLGGWKNLSYIHELYIRRRGQIQERLFNYMGVGDGGYSLNLIQLILKIVCMNKKDNDEYVHSFFFFPFQKQNRNHVDNISIAKQKNLNIFISSTIKYGNINNDWIMKIEDMI